ncbi:hypothetical protein TNCV_2576781 [Trichonephila clavipes]|nr:hypothetical protein TNCV_2576781 [Trichonephila clavipes]
MEVAKKRPKEAREVDPIHIFSQCAILFPFLQVKNRFSRFNEGKAPKGSQLAVKESVVALGVGVKLRIPQREKVATVAGVASVQSWRCGSPVVKVSDHGRHVMSSSPVPLKTRRVGQRCTLKLSRAQTSSCWWGVVVRRGDGSASSGVVLVT